MRHYNQLTQEQRYYIEKQLQAKSPKSQIAAEINIDVATLYRELKRNSVGDVYHGKTAHQLYLKRRKNSKRLTVLTSEVQQSIIEKLELKWSPEQIAGRAKLMNGFSISHQSIYNWIYQDKLNHGNLYKFLRRKRKYRKNRTKDKHLIKGRIMIDKRPAIVDKRNRLGDWEIDCIISTLKDSTTIVTAVDRTSRYICASMLDNRNAFNLARRVCRLLRNKVVKTITSDNGTEFAAHKYMAQELQCEYFFARPYHSWERGSSENANGLIRQYLPSGKALKGKWRQLSKAVIALNNRPRKCLGYLSAKEYVEKHTRDG